MNRLIEAIIAFVIIVAIAISWGLHAAAQDRRIEALQQRVIELQSVEVPPEPETEARIEEALTWLEHADMALDELERILEDNREANIVIKDIRMVISEASAELGQALTGEIAQIITEQAEIRGVDPMILTAMAYRESNFNPDARGAAGEYGLIQIMPSTGAWIAGKLGYTDWQPSDMLDVKTNIKFAAYYLWAVTKDMGDTWAGVLAYNAGPTGARNWLAGNDVGSHDYVRKVQATYNSFRGC